MREPVAVADAEAADEVAPDERSSDRVDEPHDPIQEALGSRHDCGVRAAGEGRSGAAGASALRRADRLLALADTLPVFRTPDGLAYADLEIDGHRETRAVRDREFRRWLTQQALAAGAGLPSSNALHDTLDLLETRALSNAPVHRVAVRIGGMDGRIYLDLGDTAWRAVEVDADGWRVVERPPLRFRRPASARALPVPERGGSIATLGSFLNLAAEDDLAMAVAWLLAALGDRGPFPVLVLGGEVGAGKSTFMAMMQALIDPSAARLRALPASEPALIAAARDAYALAFDNLSSVPGWFSDALCRMVSGGGFAGRRDGDPAAAFAGVARPVMLNGIADIVTRPDLADRALFVTLNGIVPHKRRTEAELWDGFEAERPRLLGALLDAVAVGLGRLPQTTVTRAPRMADLARWVEACEPALLFPGAFKALYATNQEGAARDAIESDTFVLGVREFVCRRERWVGSATQLLGEVAQVVGEAAVRNGNWPGNARVLASRLRRGAAFLRRCGIGVDFGRVGAHGKRAIWIFVIPGSEADAVRRAVATTRSTGSLASVASR